MVCKSASACVCVLQFDHPFVEVYRVRQFRFTPRYEDTDSELDLRETEGSGRKRFFSQICREHPACSCSLTHSSWNCDGEILPHAAIQVRYMSLKALRWVLQVSATYVSSAAVYIFTFWRTYILGHRFIGVIKLSPLFQHIYILSPTSARLQSVIEFLQSVPICRYDWW